MRPQRRPVKCQEDEALENEIFCYCNNLTMGELMRALRESRWPPPGRENTGRLCTGCMPDLLCCMENLKKQQ